MKMVGKCTCLLSILIYLIFKFILILLCITAKEFLFVKRFLNSQISWMLFKSHIVTYSRYYTIWMLNKTKIQWLTILGDDYKASLHSISTLLCQTPPNRIFQNENSFQISNSCIKNMPSISKQKSSKINLPWWKYIVNHKATSYWLLRMFCIFMIVIQWLNKQINETQLTHQRVGTFEMPGATSNFRPQGSALVCYLYLFNSFTPWYQEWYVWMSKPKTFVVIDKWVKW